jgi:hypothetical protein
MSTGMLWFDNSKNPLSVKIQKAMDYYEKKYGRKPDLCLVNPSMMGLPQEGNPVDIQGLNVRAYRPVLPGHIWIGIEDKEVTE